MRETSRLNNSRSKCSLPEEMEGATEQGRVEGEGEGDGDGDCDGGCHAVFLVVVLPLIICHLLLLLALLLILPQQSTRLPARGEMAGWLAHLLACSLAGPAFSSHSASLGRPGRPSQYRASSPTWPS